MSDWDGGEGKLEGFIETTVNIGAS